MTHSLVTGGTGFVGAHVVRKLVERGDRVTVFARPQTPPFLLKDIPVQFAWGDITDLDSLLWPMRNCDELYHAAADYRLWARNPEEIHYNNVIGTLNVMEAALRTEIPKVVYTSTVGCLGLPEDGSPGNEDTPVARHSLVGNYKKSKYDAEEIVREYVKKGLNAVIVNPSTPVGPGDIKPTPTGRIILDFMNGRMRGYLDTGLNLIAVEDVAEGHLLAARKGRPGERYILGNSNWTLCEILQCLARLTNREAPTLRVPYLAALATAVASGALAQITNRQPSVPMEGVMMARKKMFFSSDKAISELGLPQSSIEDALSRAVTWFMENGYIGK